MVVDSSMMTLSIYMAQRVNNMLMEMITMRIVSSHFKLIGHLGEIFN